MNDCRDCRHYRPNGQYGKCAAPQTHGSYWNYCYVHRMMTATCPSDCGSEGRFFEPRPLGRSHGIDWDRAVKTAATIAEMREFCAKHPGAKAVFWNGVPNMGMTRRTKPAVRRRFTVAEYLAALTTDYCAQGAAE